MKYSIDTSVLVVPFRHWPGPNRLTTLWDRFDLFIQNGEIVASKEVYTEIEQKDDWLKNWVRDRMYMFQDVDEETQEILQRIVNRFPKWVDVAASKNDADPWVVALAIRRDLIVVSNEMHGGEDRIRIPYVCKEFGLDHLSLKEEFLEVIDWKT